MSNRPLHDETERLEPEFDLEQAIAVIERQARKNPANRGYVDRACETLAGEELYVYLMQRYRPDVAPESLAKQLGYDDANHIEDIAQTANRALGIPAGYKPVDPGSARRHFLARARKTSPKKSSAQVPAGSAERPQKAEPKFRDDAPAALTLALTELSGQETCKIIGPRGEVILNPTDCKILKALKPGEYTPAAIVATLVFPGKPNGRKHVSQAMDRIQMKFRAAMGNHDSVLRVKRGQGIWIARSLSIAALFETAIRPKEPKSPLKKYARKPAGP